MLKVTFHVNSINSILGVMGGIGVILLFMIIDFNITIPPHNTNIYNSINIYDRG